MNLTSEEAAELKSYGSIRTTIDRFCEISGKRKVDLRECLDLAKQSINNYRRAGKIVEYNPAAGTVSIITPESVLHSGNIGE